MSGYRLRDGVALATALVAPLAAALVLVPFRDALSGTNEALVLVVVVVAVAALGNRAAAALAALSAAVWFGVFLGGTAEPETAVLLLVTGLIVGQLAVRGRALESEAADEEADLERLEGVVRFAEGGAGPQAVAEHVRAELVGLLGLRGCRFVRAAPDTPAGPATGHLPRLEHGGTIWQGLGTDDPECTYWPDVWPDGEVELPVAVAGRQYGRYLLDPPPGGPLPPLRARRLAVALAGQAGAALRTD
ncbi:histidine kinase [Streptomyces sp. NPDC012888]|uniref:histidine kinase n=1 Tax=Streptomyces sp. NPDC012888 TaxID=3364855 RepID=UPI0036BAE582